MTLSSAAPPRKYAYSNAQGGIPWALRLALEVGRHGVFQDGDQFRVHVAVVVGNIQDVQSLVFKQT